MDAEGHEWWQHAVFYEIYPRSFADSDNNGIGDLNGITAKLNYLKDLGVDAIWLTPCFPSPQVDFGYDVSDYENIDPMYGTLADFDRMASAGKQRGIRIILDLVMNHTSDQHQVVPGFEILAHFAVSRLVRLAGRQGSKSAAEQLDFDLWRSGLDLRSANRAVVLPHFLFRAARSELAQSRRRKGDV